MKQRTHDLSPVETFDRLIKLAKVPLEIASELVYGIKTGTLPLAMCSWWGAAIAWSIVFGLDERFFRRLDLGIGRPHTEMAYVIYALVLESSGFWSWGCCLHLRCAANPPRSNTILSLSNR